MAEIEGERQRKREGEKERDTRRRQKILKDTENEGDSKKATE